MRLTTFVKQALFAFISFSLLFSLSGEYAVATAPSPKKLKEIVRVNVNGKPVIDSVDPLKISGAITTYLGEKIEVKPRIQFYLDPIQSTDHYYIVLNPNSTFTLPTTLKLKANEALVYTENALKGQGKLIFRKKDNAGRWRYITADEFWSERGGESTKAFYAKRELPAGEYQLSVKCYSKKPCKVMLYANTEWDIAYIP